MNILSNRSDKEEEFRELFELYYAPFCLYAKRFIDDLSVREDIVSEVFTSLWDKYVKNELASETLVGYIKMCVRNSCLNYIKHQEYEWNYAEMVNKQEPIYSSTPDSVYTLDELYELLYKVLGELPEAYQTAFTKSVFEGKTHAEIAEELNLSVKSVNRYKQKTLEILKLRLQDYLPFAILSTIICND